MLGEVGADEGDLGEELQLLVEVALELGRRKSLATDRTTVHSTKSELCKSLVSRSKLSHHVIVS